MNKIVLLLFLTIFMFFVSSSLFCMNKKFSKKELLDYKEILSCAEFGKHERLEELLKTSNLDPNGDHVFKLFLIATGESVRVINDYAGKTGN